MRYDLQLKPLSLTPNSGTIDGRGSYDSYRILALVAPESNPLRGRKPKLTLENGLPYTPGPFPPGVPSRTDC